jgi:hypothetical protein
MKPPPNGTYWESMNGIWMDFYMGWNILGLNINKEWFTGIITVI